MQTDDGYMNPSIIASWLVSVKALPFLRVGIFRIVTSSPIFSSYAQQLCGDAVPDRPDKPDRSLRTPLHPTVITLFRCLPPSAQRMLMDTTVYSRSYRASFDIVKIGVESIVLDRYARSFSIICQCIEIFPTQKIAPHKRGFA